MPNVTEQAMLQAIDRHSAETRKIYSIALELIEAERRNYQEYDKAVDDWYRDPTTQHLRFPNCIHGTSNWTDYDNICGACEDGDGDFDYLRVAARSLAGAKERWKNYWDAQRSYVWMISHGYDAEKAGEFSQWAHNRYLVVK
jgi:hypothetical protein